MSDEQRRWPWRGAGLAVWGPGSWRQAARGEVGLLGVNPSPPLDSSVAGRSPFFSVGLGGLICDSTACRQGPLSKHALSLGNGVSSPSDFLWLL